MGGSDQKRRGRPLYIRGCGSIHPGSPHGKRDPSVRYPWSRHGNSGAGSADGYVEVCVNLGWRDVNPQKELSAMLDNIPVKSGNDANVAALGEMWRGGGMGFTDIVMVTLGTGVGGGIIIDEKIIAGKHGLGGEIGHIHVRDEEWEHCNCGGVGCVEQIASATGIAREARRRMAGEETPSVLRQYGDAVTAKDVLDAAKAGDELALSVVETVGRYLGVALAGIAHDGRSADVCHWRRCVKGRSVFN